MDARVAPGSTGGILHPETNEETEEDDEDIVLLDSLKDNIWHVGNTFTPRGILQIESTKMT